MVGEHLPIHSCRLCPVCQDSMGHLALIKACCLGVLDAGEKIRHDRDQLRIR